MQANYDYIITGAGCAGLSLLRSMMQHSFFINKKILLIDKDAKATNDRTWCFWEQQPGVLEDIVYHRWQLMDFYSGGFSARYDLQPYTYKMIRGIDLYETVLKEAKQHANVEVVYDEVQSVSDKESYAVVKTSGKEFSADYIFNSIFFYDWKQQAALQKNVYVLLQHFKGWIIETNEIIFDERIATFMDFRVDQSKGTTFVYVLPLTKNKALIEYTLFSEKLLQPEEYDAAIEQYIHSFLNIKQYSVMHKEFGVIPMTNYNFSKGTEKVINIGTAGGNTKGSSGYTFKFIQKNAVKIIDALVNSNTLLLKETIFEKRFHLYDSILLNVLYNKKMNGDRLFLQLFKKNQPATILKFLDNETTLSEELKIMNSVSLSTFLPAAIKEILR